MDYSKAKIGRIKKEYLEYLEEKNPDWTKVRLSRAVQEAFGIWNGSMAPSLWRALENDETMADAKEYLWIYWRDEQNLSNPEPEVEKYYSALVNLKEFLDSKGGVEKCVGTEEFRLEEKIYHYAKLVYDEKMSQNEAAEALEKSGGVSIAMETRKAYFNTFKAMRQGKAFPNPVAAAFIHFSLNQIEDEYGIEELKKALESLRESILYKYRRRYKKTSNPNMDKSVVYRNIGRKFAKKFDLDISFGDEIFDEISGEFSDEASPDSADVQYWIYAPGPMAGNWESDQRDGVMAIGWDELGDLSKYQTRNEIHEAMDQILGPKNRMNDTLAVWQFAREIKEGDIIFAKAGRGKIIGRGVVEGGYEYDETREQFKNIRKVQWTDCASRSPMHTSLALKTLTNITKYKDFVEKVQNWFDAELESEFEPELPSYTSEDFLREVFMSEEAYETIANFLEHKQNIILQGAPGVGKTFAAKRLAWSLMEEKDESRVQVIQFHQNYSYEDFIMGWRPNGGGGFEMRTGVFYDFCKRAEEDPERKYFFIVDEINRGNLNKIFGELFMLLEKDKRGPEYGICLTYDSEVFSIPENLYFIGMMNTADRSLALLDYALRRRFGFFEMKPAFDSEQFQSIVRSVEVPEFSGLIEVVKELNREIANDPSLGSGFCVGHSFFCLPEELQNESRESIAVWLERVLQFEILPLLSEYWFDHSGKVKEWSRKLLKVLETVPSLNPASSVNPASNVNPAPSVNPAPNMNPAPSVNGAPSLNGASNLGEAPQ